MHELAGILGRILNDVNGRLLLYSSVDKITISVNVIHKLPQFWLVEDADLQKGASLKEWLQDARFTA